MKKTLVIISIVCLAVLAGLAYASANPIFFAPTKESSTATTSPTFIRGGGLATTTLVYDSYSSSGNTAASQAMVLIQLAASTSRPTATLYVQPQYSTGYSGKNCTTSELSCDWYEDTGTGINFASTTKPGDLSQGNYYIYNFSSSTPDKAAIGINGMSTSTRAFLINTPTRWTRLVFWTPAGAGSLSYWVQIVPVKERAE